MYRLIICIRQLDLYYLALEFTMSLYQLGPFDVNPFLPTVAFSQPSSNICCPRD